VTEGTRRCRREVGSRRPDDATDATELLSVSAVDETSGYNQWY